MTSFRTIADLAYSECGLTLPKEKIPMIRSRLRHRLQSLGITDFSTYCRFFESELGLHERPHLISALTTNVSHFFRENHHFDRLREVFRQRLPQLRAGNKMRIWSAGCSNGQEAVSIALTLLNETPDAHLLDIRILGTDIDKQVVSFARNGLYPERLMGGVPLPIKNQHFVRMTAVSGPDNYEVSDKIQRMTQFNELNLLKTWPMTCEFDLIFCRNVVIYFDQTTQCRLWPQFHQILRAEGLLFLGHSERIGEPESYGFQNAGPTTYCPLPPL